MHVAKERYELYVLRDEVSSVVVAAELLADGFDPSRGSVTAQ